METSNFLENPFANCRLPLEVVLFFSEQSKTAELTIYDHLSKFLVFHQPKPIILLIIIIITAGN